MRRGKVYFKDEEAGIITQHDDGSFTYSYHIEWINNDRKPGISLTMPKTIEPYRSSFLFPVFYNLLPEGSNKQMVCQHHHIDTNDHFGILLTTARFDSIGAIRVQAIKETK